MDERHNFQDCCEIANQLGIFTHSLFPAQKVYCKSPLHLSPGGEPVIILFRKDKKGHRLCCGQWYNVYGRS